MARNAQHRTRDAEGTFHYADGHVWHMDGTVDCPVAPGRRGDDIAETSLSTGRTHCPHCNAVIE